MHNKTNSINNLNLTNVKNPITIKKNNNNNGINQASNKDATRENFYKEIRDSESNYANKDNENPLRKSTDFYFLPKLKHQNNNENSLTNNNDAYVNSNGKRNNLFKNKSLTINKSNTNFGYNKNETTTAANYDNNNIIDNSNENHNCKNNFNTNDTININTTDTNVNTFFYVPNLRDKKSFKNSDFIDESYYYRFKPSPRKSIITTNFNNTSNNNLKQNNINNENISMSVSQKKLDFKSILENEKFEEEKRLQQFFQKLNMSSINKNFPSAKNLNVNINSNNFNLTSTNANFINSNKNLNRKTLKNDNNNNYNATTKNNNNKYNEKENNYSKNDKNNKSNSEEKTNQKIQTTKNSSSNSLLHKKKEINNNNNTINNKLMTQSDKNINFNFLNQLNNLMFSAPKNNFESIRPLMTKSTENILNSVDTIKNRSKIKIVNKKLQISKEIPNQSYMITNIKPLCLFDFNNKLKGKVLMKKEIEMQKMRNLKSNPEAYYEDEEIEFNNENESEKDKDSKASLYNKFAGSSYQKIKSELQQQQQKPNSSMLNLIDVNNVENDCNNKINYSSEEENANKENNNNYNNNNNNENHNNNRNFKEEKGIILNHLEKKEKKSVTSFLNKFNPLQQQTQQQIASLENSFAMRNSEKNYFLNQNLNDISENACSLDLDSSLRNESNRNIKAEFQRKFEDEEKLKKTASKQNINLKNDSNYFCEKEEKSNAALNSSRKVSMEKNSFGAFYLRKQTQKELSDEESLEESVGSIHEDKIHNLDDSGILQVKRQESLFVKAQRKFSRGNKNSKLLASTLSLKPASLSPEKRKVSGHDVVPPVIQLNPASPENANVNFGCNSNSNNNNNKSNSNFNNQISFSPSYANYNDYNNNNNFNGNRNNQTVGSSFFKNQDANRSTSVSNNRLNINQSYVINNANNNNAITDLTEHDFEPHEVEPNLKTKTEINKIKNQINDMKKKRFDYKNKYLNDVHKSLQKKAFEINPDYESSKDIFLKYRQEKVLEKTDFNISSRLHLQNRNPIFQINNMISFPLMIDDPVFLANIYNVNMYKIETSAKNKIN